MIRTYTFLKSLNSFEDRYEYLKLNGSVGYETFGFDRYMNQQFYKSKEWKDIRSYVILRDNGLDLGMEDHPIIGRIYIHHMNPIVQKDIKESTEFLLNPEYLICTSKLTHDAIHFGDSDLLPKLFSERTKNDTIPWR